ncbi:MAG: TonB-dependent receptor [Acidobacteria bacterium]|nr:TonB-dependent receptor [Acidobacteriota bacterium]
MSSFWLRMLTLLILAIMHAGAQEFRSTISGRVLDSSGGAVPGAKLTAVNVATNESAGANSDSAGAYTIPFLRPGNYRLTVSANGFKQFSRENIVLEAAKIAGIDVGLEVGALTETVTVTAEAALLETQTASRGGVVNTQQVAELPLNARNPFMLGSMMAGVTFRGAAIWQRPFDNGAIAQWSVNGSQMSNNEFLLDGAPNNAQMGGNNIAYVPIVDAVQEFNVQSNSYDASYGKTGGGVFNVVLKSGTQSHHVTAWEFLRRKPLDANTFQNNAIGAARPNHYLDQYGFQLDGPLTIPKLLSKDGRVRAFYLGSIENYREAWPQFLNISYPEAEMRNGDFSKLADANGRGITIYNPFDYSRDAAGDPVRRPFAGNVIPASMINPIAKKVTSYMPLPTRKTPGVRYSTANFDLPDYAALDKFYNMILKFDFSIGDKHRAFMRHASNDRTEDRAVNGLDNKIGTDGQQPFQRINDAYVVDWISTLSPTLVLNVRASYNRFIEKGFGRANEGFDLTSLGLPASLVNALPQPRYFGRWDFSGYTSLGRYQSINITNTYALMGSITKIRNAHTLKMGADLRRNHYLTQNSGNILQFSNSDQWTRRAWNQSDALSGDGYANFLLGVPTGGSTNYPLYPFFRQWYGALYFQDDWKISRHLTLNLGLRWDANMAPDEKWNRLNRGFNQTAASPVAALIPAAMQTLYPELKNLKGGLEFAGVNGKPTRAADFYSNTWQPRVGAAYQIGSKLVARGGWGLYYINPSNDYLQTTGYSTSTPLVSSLDSGRTPIKDLLNNPFPNGLAVAPGASQGYLTYVGQNFSWYNADFKIPYVHQFSFGLQYQLTRTSTLEASYVGNRTMNLQTNKATNLPSLAYRKTCNILEGGSPANCQATTPNPFVGLAPFLGTGLYTGSTVQKFQMARPFPQYNGDLTQLGLNQGRIWYNSLQINYNQRFSGGLNLLANYTLSKQIERWGFNDPYADVKQQGLYYMDRPHIFKATVVYDLPFGKGRKFGAGATGIQQKLIAGWQFTTFYNDSSGEPVDLPGNVLMLKDPRIKNVDWKAHQVRGWSPCVLRMDNNGAVTPQAFSVAQGCGTDHANYSWMLLPSYAPNVNPSRSGQIRKHGAFTMDASLNKSTMIGERLRVQLGFEAFNLMNHNYYGRETFTTNANDANFGTIFPHRASSQNGYPRQVQVRMKVYW